jgi:GT2 family glycosyltransferase/glycosyltransferase involved in cell wall biosynthesis
MSVAARHRYAFAAPLCAGRSVADAGPANEAGRSLLGSAARIDAAASGQTSDVVLWLTPLRGSEVAGMLPGLCRRLAPSGMLLVAIGDDPAQGEAALSASFRHVRAYVQRPVGGSLIVEAALGHVRLAALAGPPATTPVATLLLASDSALPAIPAGLFEAVPEGTALAIPTLHPAEPAPAEPPTPAEPGLAELRGNVVALVERLVELDGRVIEAGAESARLRGRLEQAEAAGGAGAQFDVPRIQHPWPLHDAPDRDRETLTYYDHRPDDDLIAEARAGEVFLRHFRLLTDASDIEGAVGALNETPWQLRSAGEPDATIIIPVYGQLGYTLNCLDSLRTHASRHTAEVLVIDDASPDATAAALLRIAGITWHRNAENLGFLRSCNAAARLARGRVLVLLNNDTRVLPGFLDALLDTLATRPRAGLAGAKLLFPDGALQEAGAIVWRDGSAWNYGRNDDPNRPDYCHARPCDYVSGAAIAIPRALWHTIGGFDEHFAPAYCEDSDLAFRLRAAGHEAWYQPAARAIHYEGRTSGTDTTSGVKAHQVTNTARLFLRWRDTLAAHRPNGEATYFERLRGVQRRALVVDATTPTPKQDAGSITTTLTLRLFQELGYHTHYTPQDNFLFEPAHTPLLQAMGVECAYSPFDPDFDTYIRRYGRLFDAVLVYRAPVLGAVLDALRRHAAQAPVLFHAMDLHFLRLEREAAVLGTDAARDAAARMKAMELELIRRVDCTITHSTFERDLLVREVPDAPVVVWPFMFEFHGTDAGFAGRRDIVFLGGYRHGPNIDAAQFFAREVMPLITAERPGARFIVAGANPGAEVQALESNSVVVTGMVDDLRKVFDTSILFVCPLRFGAGTKGKISTAMSYGLPVVSTTCGAEGMELVEGEEVLIADTPIALARASLRVMDDPVLWSRMSGAGQRLVREKHSPEAGRRTLAEAIEVAWRHKLGVM